MKIQNEKFKIVTKDGDNFMLEVGPDGFCLWKKSGSFRWVLDASTFITDKMIRIDQDSRKITEDDFPHICYILGETPERPDSGVYKNEN
jgi:hypothetical protein